MLQKMMFDFSNSFSQRQDDAISLSCLKILSQMFWTDPLRIATTLSCGTP